MPKPAKRNKGASCGLLNNYRYLFKKAMMLRDTEDARVTKKCQQTPVITSAKRKITAHRSQSLAASKLIRSSEPSGADQEGERALNSGAAGASRASGLHGLVPGLRDSWEVDSGFCSEASPTPSGRSSPCPGPCPTTVVALDCEMVGTGPGGRCSELARCSVLDYHGNVLYDKYVRPCHPVTDYRTPWSGVRGHHLRDATPFAQARDEILTLLEGKVVVGHSIYNDFEALGALHPGHMVRDTGSSRLLGRLAGFPRQRCPSLKLLASKLLKRRIQVGRRGHCSVEDAQAALDLYKLVEGEWEQELQNKLRDDDAPDEPSFAASRHYMQDEYWPRDVTADSQ